MPFAQTLQWQWLLHGSAHLPCAGPHTTWVTANSEHRAYLPTAQPARQLRCEATAPRKNVSIVSKGSESNSRRIKFCKILVLQTGLWDNELTLRLRKKITHPSASPSVFYTVAGRKVSVPLSRRRMLIAREVACCNALPNGALCRGKEISLRD